MKNKIMFILTTIFLSSCSGFSSVQPTVTLTPLPTFTLTPLPTFTATITPSSTPTRLPTVTPISADIAKYGLMTLHVVPSYPEAHGHGDWPAETEVTLTIDDDNNAENGVLYTSVRPFGIHPWCGNPCFNLQENFKLQVGQYVSITYGDHHSKTVLISPLKVTLVDSKKDSISGIADPGIRVAVNIWSQDGKARYVTADADGNWLADFSIPGDEDFEQFTTDIVYGDHGRAVQLNPDDSDDGTLEYWSVQ